MWSTLNIDMKNLTVSREPFPDKYREMGGRGLIAQYMMDHVPPTCDPLGEENKLLICTTVFAGTNLTTAHRISIGGKSPLTGGIKESNAGGYAANLLAGQGIRMAVVEGLPDTDGLWLVHINAKGEVALEDATAYEGTNNYEFVDKMHEKYGKNIATISIGSAGERIHRIASIQISEFGEGYPSRAAARGGMGSVMGSKRLKAIVIEKPETRFEPEYADRETFKAVCTELNKVIASGAKADPFRNIGTIATIEATGLSGVLPVENFSGKLFPEYTEVGANKFLSNLASRGGRNKQICQPGCVVKCSNVYNDKEGNYLTSGFEYETIALFGPNCRISDLDVIARMDRICDDCGIDTIEVANAIAISMEMGKIPWGDGEAAIGLLQEIKDGTEFGQLLGNGCEVVGNALGCKRIPVVKHQGMAGYDPRNTKGTGITYATSPQGADHTAGLTLGRAMADTGRAAQGYASNKLQVAMAFADSMMCIFAFANCVPSMPLLADLMAGLYGGKPDITRVTGMGVKTLLTEKAYNKMAGMTEADDKIPEFFKTEASPATGSVFDVGDAELACILNF